MKIQFMSDLHIEHFPSFDDFNLKFKEKFGNFILSGKEIGHVLILAGDIANPFLDCYSDFLQYCSAKYRDVIIVAGNHEFYGNDYWSSVDRMKKLANLFANVHFLYQNSVEINGDGEQVVFLGCTLWSHVPDQALQVVQNVGVKISKFHNFTTSFSNIFKSLNDYRLISIMENGKSRTLHVTDTVRFFQEDVKWLSNELEKHKNKKVIVCTHHAPMMSGVGAPQYEHTKDLKVQHYNHAFASDLSSLIKSPIIMWIYGHTHYSIVKQTENGIIVAGNQLGYLSSKHPQIEGNNFRQDLIFEI
ncbi:predicted protein [Naegleria gruberi]|uniref:Predicted protein n=1 Tax=Naegleria gruberi TaxID=5762 RepID=D2UZ20_NAEGR|nr:uncharacterized protein NAEGRDRAFT_61782 [Naegleria gruberi]EFC50073.1 predicted protein [Naegleria gruberi]|eukprot:XP_002682817.1 predicted protein [Naegleria gruberi strain NEG-M]